MKPYFYHHREPGIGRLLPYLKIPHGTVTPGDSAAFAIVQWGSGGSPLDKANVLNPSRAINDAADTRRRTELLILHGIKADSTEFVPVGRGKPGQRVKTVREYIVPVFHLRALSVFERLTSPAAGAPGVWNGNAANATAYRELNPASRGYYTDKAMSEAVRAIYALGLDFGNVFIRVRPDGNLAVFAVHPAPRLDDRMAELYAEAIRRYAEELPEAAERTGPVVLGADPEFVLRGEGGQIVFASRFMGRFGKAGCDAIVLADRSKTYPLAELRPEPSGEPRELVGNLQRTMKYAARLIGDGKLEWVAGGMPIDGYPLGGHIHFSGVWLNSQLLRTLDNYVALPLLLLEDATTGKRRPRYGFLGDFRREQHGGFEYRTPPSWIVSPRIAAGVLSLAAAVAAHYRELGQTPLRDIEVQRMYYAGNKSGLLPIVERLWAELEQVPSYFRWKTDLDFLKDRLFSLEGWNECEDIREKWKIRV